MHNRKSIQPNRPRSNLKATLLAAALLSSLLVVHPHVSAAGQAAQQTQAWQIAPGPLDAALNRLAMQTRLTITYPQEVVAGKTTQGLSGQHTSAEALRRVLMGTGLVGEQVDARTILIRPAGAGEVELKPRRGPPKPPPTASGEREVTTRLDAVQVTGSRLKRIESEAAVPVNIYSRSDIEKSGQPTLSRFLAGLNEVSMGQGEGSFTGPVQGQGTVQLRGMPLGSTLVLLNGRRVQAVGSSGADYFNLNLIPLAAVERVEVVPVGSSAVYGGDALAGVVNIILRSSIDGVSLSTRLSSGTGFGDGGISIGTGDSGERGAWMLLGTFSKSKPLQMEERAFFRDADYRRFGGVDARGRMCAPGTVASNTSANLPGLNATFAAIPGIALGQPLTVQSFAATAGQANLCSNFAYNGSATLLHGTETLSVHASGYHDLSGSWTGFGELTVAREESRAESEGLILNNVLVPATNPNNPFGVPVRVSARLGPENGREAYARDTNFLRALAGIRGDLGADWDFEVVSMMSRDQGSRLATNTISNAAARTAALAAADSAASLNPFAAGRAASDEVLRSIWSNDLRRSFGRKVLVSGFARGAVLDLPAGSLETIIGGEAAWDDYRSVQTTSRFITKRDTRALYGELRAPLWKREGDGSEPGWTLAALTLAGRRDHYSDFGSANTYQAGLEVRPLRTLLMRASVATSFKPPTLLQTNVDDTIFDIALGRLFDPARGNEPITQGDWVRATNPGLQPETGRAQALGVLWEPDVASGARVGVTAWQVRIENLIGFVPSQTVLDNEALFSSLVTRAPAENGVPGRVTRLLLTETNFGFIQARGFDLEAARAWQSSLGRWSLSASATRATEYSVSIAPGVPAVEQLGLRFSNYWAPKWKSQLSVGFDRKMWSVGLTSRHLGSYRDTLPSDRTLGGTWQHDVSARWDLLSAGVNLGQAKAAALSLVIVNVTNVLPEYAGTMLPYFDTSQGDWRGRYASMRFSADW